MDAGDESHLPEWRRYNSVTWKNRAEALTAVIAAGETNLSRVMTLSNRLLSGATDVDVSPVPMANLGTVVALPRAGAGSIYGKILVNAVLGLCSEATESVVELGSGWGNQLVGCWLGGGPREAAYHACEPTSNGRRATELLASIEPRMRLFAHDFDYFAPAFSWFHGRGEVVVFTSHSIEQIAEIPDALFERLLDLGESVRVAHIEPVGWQIAEALGVSSALNREHKERNRSYGFNENLWGRLDALEATGRITIRDVAIDIAGTSYNPTSVIRWEKRRRGAAATRWCESDACRRLVETRRAACDDAEEREREIRVLRAELAEVQKSQGEWRALAKQLDSELKKRAG